MSNRLTQSFLIFGAVLVGACSAEESGEQVGDSFESQVEDYIRLFPYQDTYNYMVLYTQGEASALNTWALGAEPTLVRAGEDRVVRMNNDTFYKIAFVDLRGGPVFLSSTNLTDDRFRSFQLMDDRNVNYRNVIRPAGEYTLWHGERPTEIRGEAIEVPSLLSVVGVRVEVRDLNNPDDLASAEAVFNGIVIEGPTLDRLPELDLLGGFDERVEEEALRRLDETFQEVPFTSTVVGPGQEPGVDVPVLNHAAGTKGGWGGPHPSHSAYETLFTDVLGNDLVGANGVYTVTTDPPPVEAFWSLTVYDTDRGGFFHPNPDNRYHINNTTAQPNADGTVTFLFKQVCQTTDVNCLAVPAGRFDIAARYYLPDESIITGEWTLPGIQLQER